MIDLIFDIITLILLFFVFRYLIKYEKEIKKYLAIDKFIHKEQYKNHEKILSLKEDVVSMGKDI